MSIETPTGTRMQLCGRLRVRIDGRRVDHEMPGRQGRQLFAFLATCPHRSATRSELIESLWPRELPSAPFSRPTWPSTGAIQPPR